MRHDFKQLKAHDGLVFTCLRITQQHTLAPKNMAQLERYIGYMYANNAACIRARTRYTDLIERMGWTEESLAPLLREASSYLVSIPEFRTSQGILDDLDRLQPLFAASARPPPDQVLSIAIRDPGLRERLDTCTITYAYLVRKFASGKLLANHEDFCTAFARFKADVAKAKAWAGDDPVYRCFLEGSKLITGRHELLNYKETYEDSIEVLGRTGGANRLGADHEVLRDDYCKGYLCAVHRRNEILMTMTVWPYKEPVGGRDVNVQEHALIVGNLRGRLAGRSQYRNLSVRLHSFAGHVLGRAKIVCDPFETMRAILLRHGGVNIKEQHVPRYHYGRCFVFGASIVMDNNKTHFRRVWEGV